MNLQKKNSRARYPFHLGSKSREDTMNLISKAATHQIICLQDNGGLLSFHWSALPPVSDRTGGRPCDSRGTWPPLHQLQWSQVKVNLTGMLVSAYLPGQLLYTYIHVDCKPKNDITNWFTWMYEQPGENGRKKNKEKKREKM